MSYANGTPFLNLPQTIGSDHRDWFDTNESFLDLDTKVKTLWDDSGSAASAIDALEELTATLQTDLTTLSGTVDTHTSALSTINEALVLINGTLSTLNTSVATKFDSAGIADPYDATHGTYSVGAVVTYNGQRYICSTAVTAAEPFDADKWTAEDIQTVIDGIYTDMTRKVLKEVTGDGVKTMASIMNELATVIPLVSDDNKNKVVLVHTFAANGAKDINRISMYADNILVFAKAVDSVSGLFVNNYNIAPTLADCHYYQNAVTSSGFAHTSKDSEVLTSGDVISIEII